MIVTDARLVVAVALAVAVAVTGWPVTVRLPGDVSASALIAPPAAAISGMAIYGVCHQAISDAVLRKKWKDAA